MRTLFIIPLVLMSLVSFPSWGKGISGQFLCKLEFPDGSSDQYLIEVEKTILKLKHHKYPINNEYQLIFKNSKYNTLIFEMFPSVIFLSPGNKDKEIEFHEYRFYSDSKDIFRSGICEGPFMN